MKVEKDPVDLEFWKKPFRTLIGLHDKSADKLKSPTTYAAKGEECERLIRDVKKFSFNDSDDEEQTLSQQYDDEAVDVTNVILNNSK